jgi:hypothetical protein
MEKVMTTNARPLCGLASALFALTLVWAQPGSAARPSAFGPKIEIGTARDGYVGTLDVVPLHAKAGERFTVKGEKLPPNQEFQLVWETVDGNWKVTETEYKGREFTPVAYVMAKVKSDAQ